MSRFPQEQHLDSHCETAQPCEEKHIILQTDKMTTSSNKCFLVCLSLQKSCTYTSGMHLTGFQILLGLLEKKTTHTKPFFSIKTISLSKKRLLSKKDWELSMFLCKKAKALKTARFGWHVREARQILSKWSHNSFLPGRCCSQGSKPQSASSMIS